MKLVSVVVPCFNEEGNVEVVYAALKEVFAKHPQYNFELLFVDNDSTDQTPVILRALSERDRSVKVIFNNRNYGAIRSPFYGLLQARGEAIILMAADLQEPPELISQFLERWESGQKMVAGIKTNSEENRIIYLMRTIYYRTLNSLSNVRLVEHFTGFGLYDREVIEQLRNLNYSYPYLRGLVSELGYTPSTVPFTQSVRKRGLTKTSLYVMYDTMMLGLTSHSIIPMRIATICGFGFAALSMVIAFGYLIYKLIHWFSFSLGMAPALIGMFFLFSVQLALVGLLGEYINAVHLNVQKRPLVVERERLNFDCVANG